MKNKIEKIEIELDMRNPKVVEYFKEFNKFKEKISKQTKSILMGKFLEIKDYYDVVNMIAAEYIEENIRLKQELEKLKNKQCPYGGDSCYKTMLDAITDESEE